jgi:hypothetical protein
MADSTNRRRKRSKKPGYDEPFNYNKIAWVLLGLLVIAGLTIRYFNW